MLKCRLRSAAWCVRAGGRALGPVVYLVGAVYGAACTPEPGRSLIIAQSGASASTSDTEQANASSAKSKLQDRDAAPPNSASDTSAGHVDAGASPSTLSTDVSPGDTRGAAETSASAAVSGSTGTATNDAGTPNVRDVGTPDLPGMTLDEFCTVLQARARSWLRECRIGFGDSASWWGTQAIDHFCASGRAAVAAGRLAYDPLKAEACVAASVNGCNATTVFAYKASPYAVSTSPCQGVVVGSVTLGGECHADSTQYAFECAEGHCGGNTCPGHCTANVENGQTCEQSSQCNPTSYCNANSQCEAYLDVGAACSVGSCKPGLACASEAPTPVCVAKRALGDTCQWASECPTSAACYQGKCSATLPAGALCNTSAICGTGLYCVNTSCSARVVVGGDCGNGEACVEDAQCVDSKCKQLSQAGGTCPCASGLWCDSNNTCQVRGKLGTECTQSNRGDVASPCEAPLLCRGTSRDQGAFVKFTCSQPGNQGELCQSTPVCKWPLFCDSNTAQCQPAAAKDGACNPGLVLDSCQPGLYCQCTVGSCPAEQCTGSACSNGSSVPGACRLRAELDEGCSVNAGCKSGNCVSQKCAPETQCR